MSPKKMLTISGADRFGRRGGTCRLHAIFMNQSCVHLAIAGGIVKQRNAIGRVLKRPAPPFVISIIIVLLVVGRVPLLAYRCPRQSTSRQLLCWPAIVHGARQPHMHLHRQAVAW